MQKKKVIVIILLALLAAGLSWLLCGYHLVEFRLYPRHMEELDLRGQEISTRHYEKLKKRMPDTRILWEVPFQGQRLAQDTDTLTVTALTREEAELLARFLPRLRTVRAEGCTDYEALLALKRLRPEVQVKYWVQIDGTSIAGSALRITLEGITEEEVKLLPWLPRLKTVVIGGGEAAPLHALQEYCREHGLALQLRLGKETVTETETELTVTGLTQQQTELLTLLPGLKRLHLREPEADAETLLALSQNLPGTAVTWEKTVLGMTFPADAEEIDLTEAIARGEGERAGDKTAYQYSLEFPVQGTKEEVPSALKLSDYHPWPDKTALTAQLIAEVKAAMAYFPQAEKLVMCGAYLDNEAMSAFREEVREDYKVVWSVKCGKVAARTDARFFMPVKYHVYYLNNEEAANLRYCPELVSVDIGHMAVSDISFVEHLPELQYLILAHTQIQYIEPIRSCKKLKFLEVDWSPIRDFSPLTDCTALEDLNIGNTWASVEPLKEMTWLKNLWMIFRREGYAMSQALPDTRVVSGGTATVDSGWRDLPNYYAMRDELKMFYMSW